MFGIPMEVISRLERVRSGQIDSVAGMKILQYRGTSLPLLQLEQLIKSKPREETQSVFIVVFSVHDREVGLIVPNLIDIRQVSSDVDTITFREPGVIGSVVVNEKATRLLDLFELTKLAYPKWFAEVSSSPDLVSAEPSQAFADSGRPTILLAEDFGFFRKQLVGGLEEAGYDVVGCEDGQIAWETLEDRSAEFDLVITDIEMPNMDGYELARHIKADPDFAHLPIIAVTSLSSEEDMQRATEAGIDNYQVKLDRDRLMVAVARYLQEVKTRTNSNAEPAAAGTGS